ncbi:arginase family protein [Chitinophaga oryziterrae]|uniref:Arginase family protein n=1 Tax=Chitinophaga oryziterrae TaxID=1031224 RepID=A0A6N8JEE8_9BACT|nr:arginase family protein [Chitinophaga oryziterrae]MVT43610.1 arginase family protein [Chitinophaga oryziterrae]
MHNLVIIEAPSNLGLKSLQPGTEPGVRLFPEALRKTGFADNTGITQIIQVPAPPYSMDIHAESKIRNAVTIADYSRTLAAHVQEAVEQGMIPVVIGGDCSILLGNTLGLKNTGGRYGLFSIDGHTDYMLPEHSGTAGAAGMDLALVTGNGPAILSDIDKQGPYIAEEHVFSYGNRELDEDYVAVIKGSSIRYYDLPAIREQGIGRITADFLTMIGQNDLDGFWIHLDVDVLNNEIMPCVDSPQEDGLSYQELKQTLQPLLASPFFKGINITILDPALDPHGAYTTAFSAQLSALLKPAEI